MKASEELREKMWELCYGLLPDDERRALVTTIKSDPQAARLYAEVRLQTDLVGYASKVEDSSLILSPDGKKSPETELVPAAGRSKEILLPAKKEVAAGTRTKTSWVAWLPAVAALCLVALIGYGTIRPNVGPHQIAEAIVTEIEVPRLMQPGLSNKVRLRSLRMDGDPAPVELDVKLVDRLGEVQHHQVVQANEQGEATFDLPGQAVADGVRIEASARTDGLAREGYEQTSGVAGQLESAQVVSAPLSVATDEPLTYFIQDKPGPQPGEPTRYALYSVSRFGMQMQPVTGWEFTENQVAEKELAAKEFTIKQLREGLETRQPSTRMSLADGVVEGTFFDATDARLPEALALLQLEKERAAGLADQISPGEPGQSSPGQFAEGHGAGSEAARNFRMQLARDEEETRLAQRFLRATPRRNVQLLDSLALQSGKAQQMKDAEEREKLAEHEAAKGGAAALPFVEGTEEAKAKEKEGDKATKEDKAFGGASAPAPIAAQPHGYQEKIDLAKDYAAKDYAFIEPAIVSAGAPLTITVPGNLAGKRLLIEALCRDVTVASTTVEPVAKSLAAVEGKLAKNEAEATTRDASSAAEDASDRQVTIQLPPEVDGDIRVMLVDASQSPPQVVREERLYRRPARELKLALVAATGNVDAKNEFKPGEKVELKFRVLSEHDQPEAALLGVRVWREDAIEASGQEPVMLADYVRSQSALYEASGYASGPASGSMRGLARLRKGSESLDRALAMQTPRQQTSDLKKTDGGLEQLAGMVPQAAAPPLPRPTTGATTAAAPAPAAVAPTLPEAPALAQGDAQAPAPAVVDPAAVAPPAPAPQDAPIEGAPGDGAGGNSAVGNRAAGISAAGAMFGSPAMPVEASESYALAADALDSVFAAEPVAPRVVSNRNEIARQQEAAAVQDAQAWEAWRAVVGRVLVMGGLAALAGLLALFLIRTPVRAGSGTLALVGGVASLLVGAFWIADGRQATQIAGWPAVKSEVVAKSPSARASDFGNLAENIETYGQGLGGGEVPLAVEQSAALDDLPARSPTKDESLLQENAAALAQESAPAGPAAEGDRPGLGGLGGFHKETTPAADGRDNLAPSGKPGGGGGFGGGRMSESGPTGGLESLAPGSAETPARGPLRAKVPADADLANTEANADKFSAEKSRPNDATANRGGASKPAADGFPPPSAVPPAANAPAPAAAPGAPAVAAAEDRKDEPGDANVGRRRRGTDAAPVSLYFNPRLETDADGYATIEFQMPDAEADYRILIDAFGHGRIGSAEMLIMCRK